MRDFAVDGIPSKTTNQNGDIMWISHGVSLRRRRPAQERRSEFGAARTISLQSGRFVMPSRQLSITRDSTLGDTLVCCRPHRESAGCRVRSDLRHVVGTGRGPVCLPPTVAPRVVEHARHSSRRACASNLLASRGGSLMRLGIVGTGNVGCAIAFAAVMRGSAREILLLNRTSKTAEAVATDIRYGTPLGPKVDIKCGSYEALSGADVVLITSGVNEKAGGATDRNDPQGRLRLLEKNAKIYREIVPQIVRAAPTAVLVAVTDPPDPLADIAREASGHDRVLSTGTFLDSLRFRVRLGKHFGVNPACVEAQVIGDHGTAQVFLWSSARIAGVP